MKRKLFVCLMMAMFICVLATAALAAIREGYSMPYYIEVDVTNQVVTIYNTKDSTIVRQMLCSSGLNTSSRNDTPLGEFYMESQQRSSERTEWYTFYLEDGTGIYCWAKYASRIHDKILFHSITYSDDKDSAVNKEDIANFGSQASHGCIRLRVVDAKWIAGNCMPGTYVKIYESGERDEDLREILYVSSYTGESGMSYERFMGITDEEGALGRYSEGDDVTDLQMRLRDLGYYDGEITGSYGAATLIAVKNLQADLGLDRSGIATRQLQEAIFSSDAPLSCSLTLSEGFSGPVVQQLQEALAVLGLYTGPVDSVYDVEVAEAVSDFQRVYNYPANGEASPEIQQAIYYELAQLKQVFGDLESMSVQVNRENVNLATVVSESRIIIRAKASTSGDELGKVSSGDTVLIVERGDDWTKIYANSVTGYMRNKYLEFYTQENIVLNFESVDGTTYAIGRTLEEYVAGEQSPAKAFAEYYTSDDFQEVGMTELRYVTVNTGSDLITMNLRQDADANSDVINSLNNGTQLRLLSQGQQWTLVVYGGQLGYLMNDYLTFWTGDANALASDDADLNSDGDGVQTFADGEMLAVVTTDASNTKANVYASNSDSADVLGQLSKNTKVEVVKIMKGGKWVLINYRSYQGYMKAENLIYSASTAW